MPGEKRWVLLKITAKRQRPGSRFDSRGMEEVYMEEGSVCVLLKRKKQKARPKAKKGVRKREGGFYRNYRDDIDEEGVCIKVYIPKT